MAPTPVSPAPSAFARPSGGPTDAALVVSARAGEAWACEALFRRHAPMVKGLVVRLLGRDHDVDDVVQDAWVETFGLLDRIRDPQAFASFLATVVVRRVRRLLRRRRIARRLGLVPASDPVDVTSLVSPGAPPDAVAEIESIYRVLEKVPTDERLALVLRRIEGMPLEDVAACLGCSTATAKRRIAAAEETLVRATETVPPPGAPGPRRLR